MFLGVLCLATCPRAEAGITGSLMVQNQTDDTLQITINGAVRGYVKPNSSVSFFVGDQAFNRTQLKAIGNDGGLYIQQVENPPPNGDYVWTIGE